MEDLALLIFALVLAVLLVGLVSVVRYLQADRDGRALLRTSWRIRYTWQRTAIRCGLFQADHGAKVGAEVPLVGELRRAGKEKILVPRIRVTQVANGLRVHVKTVGRIGFDAFDKASDDLANAWRVRYVEVSRGKPGHLVLRVTMRDALRTKTSMVPSPTDPVDLRSWTLGTSRHGDPVTVRTSNVSGIVAGGLSGYGKTSLAFHRFVTLAPSPIVQFGLIDGKDYELEDLKPRAWLHCGDDIDKAHAIVTKFHTLYVNRKSAIRTVLNMKNAWDGGLSETWPLAVLMMDEAHTFLFESKFKDPESVRRDGLVRDMIRMIDDLVRKGRTVGIQVFLLTQKPTGDAIPTKIRDNCQIAISFAQRSKEAAVAALGDDINDYPEAHPRRLQDPAYVGVLSVQAEGRPGYTLARNPQVRELDAINLAEATAHLVRDPLALLEYQLHGLHAVNDKIPA